ncbi:MAG: hypothetical protein EAZ06_04310 [Cytophagales bacterium]|nr:MAG: hypothetical protein EAZ06_04310 [Cytophagales bacterium]
MAKGMNCPHCGTYMYAIKEDYQHKGTWVTYQCRNGNCKFECREFEDNLLQKKTETFVNNSNLTTKNMGNTNFQFRLQSLDVIKDFEQRLQKTNENLKKEIYDLKVYFEALAEGDMWNDRHHSEYAEEYLSEVEKSINQVVNLIENESMKYLQNYKHKAEEVGFS